MTDVVEGSMFTACCGSTLTVSSLSPATATCSCGRITAAIDGKVMVAYQNSGTTITIDHTEHP